MNKEIRIALMNIVTDYATQYIENGLYLLEDSRVLVEFVHHYDRFIKKVDHCLKTFNICDQDVNNFERKHWIQCINFATGCYSELTLIS